METEVDYRQPSANIVWQNKFLQDRCRNVKSCMNISPTLLTFKHLRNSTKKSELSNASQCDDVWLRCVVLLNKFTRNFTTCSVRSICATLVCQYKWCWLIRLQGFGWIFLLSLCISDRPSNPSMTSVPVHNYNKQVGVLAYLSLVQHLIRGQIRDFIICDVLRATGFPRAMLSASVQDSGSHGIWWGT